VKCQPNKAFVGTNAFVHESAAHALQILQGGEIPLDGETYNPAVVGAKVEVTIGPTSLTEDLIKYRLDSIGLKYTDKQVTEIREKLRNMIEERGTNMKLVEFDEELMKSVQ
jgi:isopropylmalate/homocitrate/citramalate synthase